MLKAKCRKESGENVESYCKCRKESEEKRRDKHECLTFFMTRFK